MIDSMTGVIVLSNLEKRFSREVLSKNTFFYPDVLDKSGGCVLYVTFPIHRETWHKASNKALLD